MSEHTPTSEHTPLSAAAPLSEAAPTSTEGAPELDTAETTSVTRAVLLLVTLALLGAGVAGLAMNLSWLIDSESTQASVLESTTGEKAGQAPTWNLRVSYPVKGKIVESELNASRTAAAPGETLNIWYRPDTPQSARQAESLPRMLTGPAVLLLAGSLTGWRARRCQEHPRRT